MQQVSYISFKPQTHARPTILSIIAVVQCDQVIPEHLKSVN